MDRSPSAPIVTPDPSAAPWLSQAAQLLKHDRPSAAIATLQRSILAAPEQPWLWYGLAMIHSRQHRWDTALTCIRKLLKLEPNALDIFNQPTGLALDPHYDSLPQLYALCLYHQGIALERHNQTDGAIANYRQALEILPHFIEARMALADGLLRSGQLGEGFAVQATHLSPSPLPVSQGNPKNPRPWDGSPIVGKTLLLVADAPFAEQELRPLVQWARFVAIAAQRCERLLLQVPPSLAPLFNDLTDLPADTLSTATDQPFDYQASFSSLPALLGIKTIADLPRQIPYLCPPSTPQLPPPRKPTPDGHRALLKIAIDWGCGHNRETGQGPAPQLAHFAAIAHLPQVQCYSVHPSITETERHHLQGLNIIDLSPSLDHFATTATYLNQCDLVITVDTTTAHLAGAIARPTWIALPFHSHWTWLSDRDDSPWYPTARLFRQPTAGDWDSTFTAIAQALQSDHQGSE